jgi:hypothetical protein
MAAIPGSESRYRVAVSSLTPCAFRVSTTGGIKVATGIPEGKVKSATTVPACTDTRRSHGSDTDTIDPLRFG